ncbi:MAG: hypothetical protein ACK4OO_00420 [bacterium]
MINKEKRLNAEAGGVKSRDVTPAEKVGRSMSGYLRWLSMALVAVVVMGCSKPPEMEMKAANDAIASAKAAEAESYAPKAFRTAQDTLNAANAAKQEQDGKFALFRSYSRARDLYVRAEALAKEAESQAKAEKERVRAEVEQMITNLKAQLDEASQMLAKAPVGKGNKADIEMLKSDLASIQTAYDDAQNDFNNGKFLVARSKLNNVSSQVANIKSQIEQAAAKVRGRR